MLTAELHGARLRAQFSNAQRTALIDGIPVALDDLTVRRMNFGQHWRTPGITPVTYSLELPKAFLVAFLREPDHLPDLLEDIKQSPDDDEPLDLALIAAGFPTAEDLCDDPVLFRLVVEFFDHDLLVRWLGDGPGYRRRGFVLNSVGSIELRATGALLEGDGRAAGIPVEFQDL